VSFTSNDSGSYYYDMYFHQQSLYAAVVVDVTPNYSVSVNGDIADTRYRENDGANRVNQLNIDNGTYLTGAPVSPIAGFGTEIDLTGTTVLSGRTIIDEPAGNGAHALHGMLQIIQTLKVTDNFSISNNTFYDYMNRYNQVEAYYADTAKGSYTLENKTDFKLKFHTGSISHDADIGFTYRYAHVDDIQNFASRSAFTICRRIQPRGSSLRMAPTRQTSFTAGPSRTPPPSVIRSSVCPAPMPPMPTARSTPICRTARYSWSIGCSSRRSGACCTGCAATWCS
jgi:hypothetical protein